jgi:chemotaxis protein MotB
LEVNQGKLKVNQKKLKDKETELADKEKELLARERLVQELRASIQRKEAEQQKLFQSLQSALGNFSAEELIVERRGGRVYVSLSDKLLFKPGDIKVDPQGKMALAKVANVLNKNPKIDVIIEGHTDNVPIKTAVYKDNWDLSVYRATSIVRILTEEYSVSPLNIIASGRGEHYAIADNENVEGKAKNRRTEIILMPKLDEIYSIIQR